MAFALGTLHRICFYLHIAAATAILMIIRNESIAWGDYKSSINKSFLTPSVWYYLCWKKDLELYAGTVCDDDEKRFESVNPEGYGLFEPQFNTATAVVFFSYFSGFCHYVAMLTNAKKFEFAQIFYAWVPFSITFKELTEVNYTTEILVRAIDYMGTAPVMLALFSVLWGANNVVGVLVGPPVLGVIIAIAFWQSAQVWDGNSSANNRKYIVFACLAAAYLSVLGMGVIYSLIENSRDTGTIGRGVMPPGVIVGSSFVLVTFSSFVFPYWYELSVAYNKTSGGKARTIALLSSVWSSMSLISKLVLHVVFGIGVTSQARVFNVELDEPPASMETEKLTAGAAGGVVGSGIIFFIFCYCYLVPGK